MQEKKRLEEDRTLWRRWGAFVSDRQWGTVREDYSASGDAWNYFPFDEAHKRAYRWGEDGIAALCDRYQVLVMAPAFWNGNDPILKERLFGLASHEGNHGEDVKELYYYLDALPSGAYMKFLYKYPQAPFPYEKLRDENKRRTRKDEEYELVDTGVFNENRYFDIYIEYAKESPDEICARIEVINQSDESAPFDLIMQLWFRNQWSFGKERMPEPAIEKKEGCTLVADDSSMLSPPSLAFDYHLGKRFLYGPDGGEVYFTDNDTGKKDAFHKKIVERKPCEATSGTKAALHYHVEIEGKKSKVFTFRLSPKEKSDPIGGIEELFSKRRKEADAFYDTIHPPKASDEEKMIQREALSGLLWNQQIYLYDVDAWLTGDDPRDPPPEERKKRRNHQWKHLNSMRILSMPDKWEYPWFAAWDLSFHCVTLALVDMQLAKEMAWLLLFDQFQHPSGQIPAYEWEFSDLNPPVQAWAILRLHRMQQWKGEKGDREFLERCFHKLLMNFAWWVNKVDSSGNNVFEGGFLGLDNITLIDRSEALPGGAKLEQSDGTGWMAMFCLNLMNIALELSKENKVYESLATKFFEHYVYIAAAMKKVGNRDYELWSDRDSFFYDVLTFPDGTFEKFRVRSLVGIIPMYATAVLDEENISNFSEFYENFIWFLKHKKELTDFSIIETENDGKKRYILTLMKEEQLLSVLKYIWNPDEFLSPYGLRSLSKYHEKHPFVFKEQKISYEPGESLAEVKGGNSNWRGPIWLPTTFLATDALMRFHHAFGEKARFIHDDGEEKKLNEMAKEFGERVISIFKKDPEGKRPLFGKNFPFQEHILFYEYYHAESGKGLGASHQTGWSALVANYIDQFRR